VGRPYVVRVRERPVLTESTLAWTRPDSWSWLRDIPPDEELGGGSILVWRDLPTDRIRAEKGK
jgi:hypothetical protein